MIEYRWRHFLKNLSIQLHKIHGVQQPTCTSSKLESFQSKHLQDEVEIIWQATSSKGVASGNKKYNTFLKYIYIGGSYSHPYVCDSKY